MVSSHSTPESQEVNWVRELSLLAYAQGKPLLSGKIKTEPEDFVVTELMEVSPSGQGEHYWLDISKTKCNTDFVAKQLARFAGVAHRDIGYSGLKDYYAQTRQWFSVWKPKGGEPDWSSFKPAGVEVHQVLKHNRKIRRGTHRANQFEIRIRDLVGEMSDLEQRLKRIQQQGVPNYFGAQRFGRDADNLNKAVALFSDQKTIKNQNLRSIVLSSARSWLFNVVTSARVDAGTWQTLQPNEPANLNASNSLFISQGDEKESQRLLNHDIHPTAPMWGEGVSKIMQSCSALADWEADKLAPYQRFQSGLEAARLAYQRRPIRCAVRQLNWQSEGNELVLSFELQRGQFATSVIREAVNV